jgi:hypothetical protein
MTSVRLFNVRSHTKPATVNNSTEEQMNRQADASAKSKELQSNAQNQRFAAHLLLPQPHKSNQKMQKSYQANTPRQTQNEQTKNI